MVEEGAPAPPLVEEGALAPPLVEEGALAPPLVEEGALAPPLVEEGALAPVTRPRGVLTCPTTCLVSSSTRRLSTTSAIPSAPTAAASTRQAAMRIAGVMENDPIAAPGRRSRG